MDNSVILSALALISTILIAIVGWKVTHSQSKEILKLQQSLEEQKSTKESQRKRDVETLNKLIYILKKKRLDLVTYLQESGVTGGYSSEIHLVMEDFRYFCSDPENTFVNKEIKEIQIQLNKSIQDLVFYLREHSAHAEGTFNSRVVFPLQRETYKERFSADDRNEIRKTAKKIDETIEEKTDAVLDNYIKLINTAKNIGL